MSTDVETAIQKDDKVLKFDENKEIDASILSVEIDEDGEEPTEEELAEAAETTLKADADGVIEGNTQE